MWTNMSSSPPNPPTSYDTANLVISFVGVVAVVATIVGGIAAWYGTVTFKDIVGETRKIESRVTQQQTVIENQIKESKSNIDEFIKWKKDAELKNQKMQMKLIKFYIKEKFNDFQSNFDNLRLSELHRSILPLNNLRSIVNEFENKYDFPSKLLENDELEIISHMKKLYNAILLIKDKKYKEATEMFPRYRGKKINIHRILSFSYANLFDKNKKNINYLDNLKYHADKYRELSTAGEKRHLIAITHSVTALLESRNDDDINKAEKLLQNGIKMYPNESTLRYDLAIIYVRRNEFNKAVDRLFQAKERGDFSSNEDIKYFCSDGNFKKLIKIDDMVLKNRIKNLLGSDVEVSCK